MHYDKLSVEQVSLPGKRVLLRVDFNVPLRDGEVADDTRIRAALPTIRYLLEQGTHLVTIASHLGRPRGKVVPELRLNPVARRLEVLLGWPVKKMDQVTGPQVQEAVAESSPGTVILLENLRFEEGEEKNDPELSRQLAELADLFVNDAFGTAHRAHASTVGVANYIPAVAGLLMTREIEFLSRCLEKPNRPLVAILGGAKISDKLGVIRRFLTMADCLLIGGGMANTFLAALGYDLADSLYERDLAASARELWEKSQHSRCRLLLPVDLVIAKDLQPGSPSRTITVPPGAVPAGWKAVDIGPATADRYGSEISGAKMVIWNGPLGVFETEPYHRGTEEVARSIAGSGAFSVVGGGDIVAALEKFGLTGQISFISTGGGATLEFWEGKSLPGIAVLKDRS
ncbi:MAG TPA: phosphoglycerate kinase [Firmicutes bacterium]|nr:phosphoglycerate kinase [Bacillota bacterium]